MPENRPAADDEIVICNQGEPLSSAQQGLVLEADDSTHPLPKPLHTSAFPKPKIAVSLSMRRTNPCARHELGSLLPST